MSVRVGSGLLFLNGEADKSHWFAYQAEIRRFVDNLSSVVRGGKFQLHAPPTNQSFELPIHRAEGRVLLSTMSLDYFTLEGV
jgi:hypothetical protein